jgi:diacylglycerol diphosphate phosphatase / phosphatidate phosphatase
MPRHASTKHGRQKSSWIQQPGVIGAIGRFWERSYAPDYLGFALLLTVYILVKWLLDEINYMLIYMLDGDLG